MYSPTPKKKTAAGQCCVVERAMWRGAWCARSESRNATESPTEPTAALSLLKHTHTHTQWQGHHTNCLLGYCSLCLGECVCVCIALQFKQVVWTTYFIFSQRRFDMDKCCVFLNFLFFSGRIPVGWKKRKKNKQLH